MVFRAHGVTISLAHGTVRLTASPLAAALGAAHLREIPTRDITEIAVEAPTPTRCGQLRIITSTASYPIVLAPGADYEPLHAALSAVAGQEAVPSFRGDFVALAVHRAAQPWQALAVLAAVRVRGGTIVDELLLTVAADPLLSGLPPADLLSSATPAASSWHGMSTATALRELRTFLGDDILIAHNLQPVLVGMTQAAQRLDLQLPDIDRAACTLALARRASATGLIELPRHRLAEVFQACGGGELAQPEYGEHPENIAAILMDQARATATVASELSLLWQADTLEQALNQAQLTWARAQAGTVFPVLSTTTAPASGKAEGAGTDFRRSAATSGESAAAADAPEDTAAEAKAAAANRRRAWDAVAAPATVPEPNPEADPNHPLYGHTVTLTGDFAPFDKAVLWDALADHGAKVAKSVTKKTSIVVIGPWPTVTSKQRRAEELIAAGQEIQLWTPEQLLQAVGLDEQPPF